MVSIGSVTIKDPELFEKWITDFGADKFLPGADVLDKKIKINGWKEDTGINIFDFISSIIAKGINRLFCTDISKDGMLEGPAIQLYKEIVNKFPGLKLIASGGISCFEDLVELNEIGWMEQLLEKRSTKKKSV